MNLLSPVSTTVEDPQLVGPVVRLETASEGCQMSLLIERVAAVDRLGGVNFAQKLPST
jgi:hypothetical protein